MKNSVHDAPASDDSPAKDLPITYIWSECDNKSLFVFIGSITGGRSALLGL
jgi:hypothetical protein